MDPNRGPSNQGFAPLGGIRVLDLGILIPPAVCTQRLAALGADVVKVERPGLGDYLDRVGPFYAGRSPHHMTLNAGKRSVQLDVTEAEGLAALLDLIANADVVVENSRPGWWTSVGVDFAELRSRRPQLIVCSITGFGQTGPWADRPSHGLNMDALADSVVIDDRDGEPQLGWVYTSWGSQLGGDQAALAICAVLAGVRGGGVGAWIDLSCWDAAVEAHREEICASLVSGSPVSSHDREFGNIYNTYRAADGKIVLLGALEPKFWKAFCERVGRSDLLDAGGTQQVDYGDSDPGLRAELAAVFKSASAVEWDRRFCEWDIPGCQVMGIVEIIDSDHFAERRLVKQPASNAGYPTVGTPIRWHDHNARAGDLLRPAPDHGEHTEEVLAEWRE